MSHPTASVTAGKVNKRVPPSRDLVIGAALAAVALWATYSFAQEAYLSQRLHEDAGRIRDQNVALQAQNDGYRKEIGSDVSGAAAEEEARTNGYVRSDEKLIVVNRPPAEPAPAPSPVTVKVETSPGNPLGSIRRWLDNLWRK
jgi:hypothetical protein